VGVIVARVAPANLRCHNAVAVHTWDVPNPISSHWRVYFILSSKEGTATISVDHRLGNQGLILPVFPMNAVPEALPLLEPAFAHYVAQWEKIMVPDPYDADARGFYIEGNAVPSRIADPSNLPQLSEIVRRHTPEEWQSVLGPDFQAVYEPFGDLGNVEDVTVSADEAGITPFGVS
jgi:hypothetical protein